MTVEGNAKHQSNNKDLVWMQFCAASSATLLMLAAGTNFGWTGPALLKLKNHDGTDIVIDNSSQLGWIASLLSLGAVIGPIFGALSVDKIGRKLTILLTSIPYIFTWLLIYFAYNVYMLYAARFFVGLTIGTTLNIIPMYLGEISSPSIRGLLSNFMMLQCNIGVLAAYVIGSYVTIKVNALINISIPVLLLVTFIWMPESPYYYLMRGKPEEAKRVLRILRGPNTNAELEIATIEATMEREKLEKANESFWKLFTVPSYRKALIIVTGLYTSQQFVGNTALLSYADTLFDELSNSNVNSFLSGIIMNAVALITTIIFGFLVDLLGRKSLMLFSSITSIIPLFLVSLYFLLIRCNVPNIDNYSLIPTISLWVFPFLFGVGIGPLPFVCMAELFPTSVKAFASWAMAVYSSIGAFLVVELYEIITSNWGTDVMFGMYTVICLLTAIFVYFGLPETKRKTLEEIQEDLRS